MIEQDNPKIGFKWKLIYRGIAGFAWELVPDPDMPKLKEMIEDAVAQAGDGGANPVGHTTAPLYPNSVVLDVGKAKKLYLYAANPSYKPVAGWMKIWVR